MLPSSSIYSLGGRHKGYTVMNKSCKAQSIRLSVKLMDRCFSRRLHKHTLIVWECESGFWQCLSSPSQREREQHGVKSLQSMQAPIHSFIISYKLKWLTDQCHVTQWTSDLQASIPERSTDVYPRFMPVKRLSGKKERNTEYVCIKDV